MPVLNKISHRVLSYGGKKRGVTIHFAATNHSEFITLVAGKRLSLLMAGNDEVYDKKLQRYAVVNLKPK